MICGISAKLMQHTTEMTSVLSLTVEGLIHSSRFGLSLSFCLSAAPTDNQRTLAAFGNDIPILPCFI